MILFLVVSRQLHLGTYFMVMPFFALYLKNIMEFTSSQTGFVIGINTLTYAVFVLWVRHISDHINNKIFLFISYTLWSISFLGFYFSVSYYSFLLFSFLSGISMCFSSVDRILLVILSEDEVYMLQKFLRPIYYTVMGVSPLIGAMLYEYDVKMNFIVTFTIFVIIAILTLFFVNNKTPLNKDKHASFLKKFKSVIQNRSFMIFILGSILLTTAVASDNLLHSIYFDKQGFEPFMVSFYFFCLAFLSFLSIAFLLVLKKRIKLKNEFLLGCLLYMIGTSIYLITSISYVVIVIIAIFIAIGDYFLTNNAVVVKKMATKGEEGIYSGMLSFIDIAWFISPLFLGYMLDLNINYYIVSILGLVAISMLLFKMSLSKV